MKKNKRKRKKIAQDNLAISLLIMYNKINRYGLEYLKTL